MHLISSSVCREQTQRSMASWSRLAGQLCRLPNALSNALPTAKKGCFIVKFSHDGRSLACACHGREGYPILVYEVGGEDKHICQSHYVNLLQT